MELLIAGGIALAGYSMSAPAAPRAPATRKKHAKLLGPSTEYACPGNSTAQQTRDHVARAQARWEAARDPALTGIVTPNTKLSNAVLPFFTSAKKQNTNDAVKQTKMEAFTGANELGDSMTGTYKNKREVEAFFPPNTSAGRVTSGGTSGNPMYTRDDERLESGVVQNNVMPMEQIRVGPGVGVGPDVAATDGFHPMLRILPKNVGDYKKNNLPGQVNHGRAPVEKLGQAGKVSVNHNPGALVVTQERRPPMPVQAAVLAPRNDAAFVDPSSKKAANEFTEDRFGNPTAKAHEFREYTETRLGYESGRDHPDRNHAFPSMNATGAVAGVGAFTGMEYDHTKFQGQNREWTGGNGFLTGPVTRAAPSGFLVPQTQRNMTSFSYVGPSGRNDLGYAVRKGDDAKHTLREGVNSAQLVGAMGAVKGGTLDNVWRYKRLGRESKRQASGRTPLPGRVNVMKPTPGSVALRPPTAMMDPVAPMASIPNKGYHQALGKQATPNNKLPTANPRLDLGLAVEQLRDNPYAKPLWTM